MSAPKTIRSALLRKQPLNEDELPALADKRAEVIRTHMLTVHSLPEARVAIEEREDFEDEDDEWVRCRLSLDAMEGVAESAQPAIAAEPANTP